MSGVVRQTAPQVHLFIMPRGLSSWCAALEGDSFGPEHRNHASAVAMQHLWVKAQAPKAFTGKLHGQPVEIGEDPVPAGQLCISRAIRDARRDRSARTSNSRAVLSGLMATSFRITQA